MTTIAMLTVANGDMHYGGRKAAEVEKDELVALLYAARGETAEALRVAQLAVEAEALMVPSGPPDDFKPAQELLGEMLLKAGRADEAAEAFRAALLRAPNRAASVAGLQRATAASGAAGMPGKPTS